MSAGYGCALKGHSGLIVGLPISLDSHEEVLASIGSGIRRAGLARGVSICMRPAANRCHRVRRHFNGQHSPIESSDRRVDQAGRSLISALHKGVQAVFRSRQRDLEHAAVGHQGNHGAGPNGLSEASLSGHVRLGDSYVTGAGPVVQGERIRIPVRHVTSGKNTTFHIVSNLDLGAKDEGRGAGDRRVRPGLEHSTYSNRRRCECDSELVKAVARVEDVAKGSASFTWPRYNSGSEARQA